MLQHIRHLVRAASYNRRTLLNPISASSLGSAWLRNEIAYASRTRRLSKVLGVDSKTIERLFAESMEVLEYCKELLTLHSTILPGLLNPNYGPVLYASVRVLKPEVMVETGVGSGVSSTFYLSAMERNKTGRLYSIDLPLENEGLLPKEKRTGWLVPERPRENWELILGDAKAELPALLKQLGSIDVFYHDSDHSYEHMMWEFNLAYPRVRPGGMLLSDDVTNNAAWKHFTNELAGSTTTINRTGVHRKAG
jgi:predicted O-methyltransferase YrrM